jgi:hypothetical protein
VVPRVDPVPAVHDDRGRIEDLARLQAGVRLTRLQVDAKWVRGGQERLSGGSRLPRCLATGLLGRPVWGATAWTIDSGKGSSTKRRQGLVWTAEHSDVAIVCHVR